MIWWIVFFYFFKLFECFECFSDFGIFEFFGNFFKVNEGTIKHCWSYHNTQKWPKVGQNTIKMICLSYGWKQHWPKELEVGTHSGPYLLVIFFYWNEHGLQNIFLSSYFTLCILRVQLVLVKGCTLNSTHIKMSWAESWVWTYPYCPAT